MSLYKNKYRIESTRLKNWDYTNIGYYFVTTCIHNHHCILGSIVKDIMNLNRYGQIVYDVLSDLGQYYKTMLIDGFVVMPNHVHLIVFINKSERDTVREFSTRDHDSNSGSSDKTGWKPVSTEHGCNSGSSDKTGWKPVSTEHGCNRGSDDKTGWKPVSTNTDEIKYHGLSEIIRGFKTYSARQINESRKTKGQAIWQKRFHEHIIRSEVELGEIRKYVQYNPLNWEKDKLYIPD